MAVSRQQLRADPARSRGHVALPRLRAAAYDSRTPVTRRAAALETLFGVDWERGARRWHRNLALTAESYRRARIVVEHVLAPELAAPLTLLAARYA
jgi:hypothetical protein